MCSVVFYKTNSTVKCLRCRLKKLAVALPYGVKLSSIARSSNALDYYQSFVIWQLELSYLKLWIFQGDCTNVKRQMWSAVTAAHFNALQWHVVWCGWNFVFGWFVSIGHFIVDCVDMICATRTGVKARCWSTPVPRHLIQQQPLLFLFYISFSF